MYRIKLHLNYKKKIQAKPHIVLLIFFFIFWEGVSQNYNNHFKDQHKMREG
jgi:hypothetical protein